MRCRMAVFLPLEIQTKKGRRKGTFVGAKAVTSPHSMRRLLSAVEAAPPGRRFDGAARPSSPGSWREDFALAATKKIW